MKKARSDVFKRALWILLLCGIVGSCAPVLSPSKPPASYKGPIAERPMQDSGYSWVYESVHGRRGTRRNLYGNYGFPLWVGKSWVYVRSLVSSKLLSPLAPLVHLNANAYVKFPSTNPGMTHFVANGPSGTPQRLKILSE